MDDCVYFTTRQWRKKSSAQLEKKLIDEMEQIITERQGRWSLPIFTS